ncbi:HdeD family acid-resistance protein [Aristophania vespae]|uniref:HdeD family acid-resistance protein n=1 Tax=Aristophania vespae TaxID=2697033 RepID=UPI00235183A4|nr:DUF308 domain-containing protein [Aristophania vespae]UMM63781.1 hypothetical protein DM15PD_07580 [Aristophania vespae]
MDESNRFRNLSDGMARVGLKPGWFIGMGIAMLILGILAFIDAFSVTLASTVVLGILLMAGGVIQFVQGIAHFKNRMMGRWVNLLIGFFIILAGLILCAEPIAGSQILTAFLAGLLVLGGFSKIFWAVNQRDHAPDWWVAAFGGAITLVVGILLYWYLPWSGFFFIGTLIAIELLVAGLSSLLFGLGLRRVRKEGF